MEEVADISLLIVTHSSKTDFRKQIRFYPSVVDWMKAGLNASLRSIVRK